MRGDDLQQARRNRHRLAAAARRCRSGCRRSAATPNSARRVVVLGLAAMSLNFLLGFTGVLSFGHAAYFGLGAYGAGMTLKYLVPSTSARHPRRRRWSARSPRRSSAPLIIRLRGVYFAMVTIAFGQVFYFIAFRWNTVTGGDDGLTGWTAPAARISASPRSTSCATTRPSTTSSSCSSRWRSAAWRCCLRSPFGRTLLAIRENERRARFLGIPVDQHIWISLVISCFFVSLAGTLYALLNNFVDPRALHWDQSGNFVIMAVLGGMRSFWGPLIGAAIFVVLQDYRLEPDRRTGCRSSACSSCWSCCSSRAACSASSGGGPRHEPAPRRECIEAFRQPRRRQQCLDDRRARRTARDHRPERRRQDDLLQSDQRIS